jgi:hypothetical protein
MKIPNKHAEIIKAWADGAEIEFYDSRFKEHRWRACGDQPWWQDEVMYRIKPAPFTVTMDVTMGCCFPKNPIRLTFDRETGKLKSAEVL